LISWLLSLSRINKQLTMLFVDSVFLVLTLFAAFSVRPGYWEKLGKIGPEK